VEKLPTCRGNYSYAKGKFAVISFKNATGTVAWRVDGRLHGARVRRNFKTREEALAERSSLELQAVQASTGMRSVATTLSSDQIRDAEVAFRRLAGNARPLAFYLDFALANYREPEKRKSSPEAVAECVAAKKREFDRDQISCCQYDRVGWELKRLMAHFKRTALAEITSAGARARAVGREIDDSAMRAEAEEDGVGPARLVEATGVEQVEPQAAWKIIASSGKFRYQPTKLNLASWRA
jgi:hypothetical protein